MSLGFYLRWLCVIFLLWFVPWVWTLYLGFLIYFPYEADGTSRYIRITGPLLGLLDEDQWTFQKNIPESCKQAVIAAEDVHFYDHAGIDVESIKAAVKRNERAGKKKWGASTITQQLVKNAFLSRKRTYVRKTREIIGAVLLDAIMTKEQQLMWYFNIVEFGPRIYGIHAAAEYYFKKKPSRLSTRECALLVSLLPSPNRSGQYLKIKTTSRAIERRVSHIMRALSPARADNVDDKQTD